MLTHFKFFTSLYVNYTSIKLTFLNRKSQDAEKIHQNHENNTQVK